MSEHFSHGTIAAYIAPTTA